MHTEWSIKSVEAGKHVLCEKPFTRNPDDVTSRLGRRRPRRAASCPRRSCGGTIRRPRACAALIDEGAIGEVRLIRSAFSYSLYDEDNIRLRTDVEGGALMDVGCYCVSGSRLAAGAEPVQVYGSAWYGPTGTDWVFTGSLRFPGDVLATFDCGTALPNRDELEVVGSEGSLFLDDPWHASTPVIELRRGDEVERIEHRARELVPARAGERRRGGRRRGRAPARPRRRDGPGPDAGGAAPLGADRRARLAVVDAAAARAGRRRCWPRPESC